MDPRYTFMLSHGMDARLTASLNDVPFYRVDPEPVPVTRTASANHLLVPGENVFSVEILESTQSGGFLFELAREPALDAPVFRCDWPALWRYLPVAQCKLPFVHAARFRIDDVRLEPAWVRSDEADFEAEDKGRLWGAVRRFHEAFARGDPAAIAEEGALKLAEFQRMYPGEAGFTAEAAVAQFTDFFSTPYEARPLAREDVIFERRAGGRVAYVRRRGGGHVVDVRSVGKPRAIRADLWLTRVRGAWRLFR